MIEAGCYHHALYSTSRSHLVLARGTPSEAIVYLGRRGNSADSVVSVYDSDGVNPYSIELSRVLASRGIPIRLVTPVSARQGIHISGVTVQRILASNLRATKMLQAIRLFRGCWTLVRVGIQRDTVVLSWTRSGVEDLLAAVLAKTGVRIIVIQHNLDFRVKVSTLRRWTREQLLINAPHVVTHSASMASQLSARLGRPVDTAPLPLYTWWLQRYENEANGSAGPGVRFVLVGAMRPDKGLEELAGIFGQLRDVCDARIELLLTGPGCLGSSLTLALEEMGIQVIGPTHQGFVSDEDVARVLSQADICIAPYTDVSQSASVILALTVGLPVVAYDVGGLSELLRDEDLIPLGETQAFALRLKQAVDGGRPTTSSLRLGADDWESASAAAWAALVGHTR